MIKESVFFQEIVQGSSSVKLGDLFVFVKHPTVEVHCNYERVYDEAFEKAKRGGSYTNLEAERFIIEEGFWTKEDQLQIKEIKTKIEELEIYKASLKIPSKTMQVARQIQEQKALLGKREITKSNIKPVTAEFIASMKVNDLLVVNSFFTDAECLHPLYSYEDYQEMERDQIVVLTQLYRSVIDRFGESQLKEFVLSDFFSPYFSLYTNPIEMFGLVTSKLTRQQLSVCFYSKLFKNIFENIPRIPKNVQKDPEALLEYAENYDPNSASGSSGGRSSKARDADAGARVIVGGNKDDVERMRGDDEKTVSLNDLVMKASKDGSNSASLSDIMVL